MGIPMDSLLMPRASRVPHELKIRPFSLEEARLAGLTPSALKGKRWRRIGASLYCWHSLKPDVRSLVAAWRQSLPPDAAFTGRTAAWLHGLELEPDGRLEVCVPVRTQLRSREGLDVWRCDIDPTEITIVRGTRVTTLGRTLLDLCARRPAVEALIALDCAVRRKVSVAELEFARRPGAARLRRLIRLAAPAESAVETRLRWLLLSAGLPAPTVQVDLHDADGRFVARADLYYRPARLVIEFDGGNHRERLVADDRRQNALIGAGFRILRFTSADVYRSPEIVAAQVRGALARLRAPSAPA